MYRANNLEKTSVLSSVIKVKDLIKSWKIVERLISGKKRKNVNTSITVEVKHTLYEKKKVTEC
jgi:hypothetical protein